MQGKERGKRTSRVVTRALTIWLSLYNNSGSGDDCSRGHSRKKSQSRSRYADSHEIVNQRVVKLLGVRGRTDQCGEGSEGKLSEE